jgi:adenylate cyclase
MRFIPSIRFGTEGYPEKVARRLRATNILTCICSAGTALFAVLRLLDGSAHWKYAAVVAVSFALVPLLHRFGPLAAPLAVVAIAYIWLFGISLIVGIDGGILFPYLTAAALGILLIGAERVSLTVLIGAGAAGAMILLRFLVPHDGDTSARFYGNFIINVLGSSAALYGIVFYAVRQLTRAEEKADREYQRSESLLANILPPQIAERLKERPGTIVADAYPEASILFADMGGFTAKASDITPEELVRFLNRVYTELDSLVEGQGLEKIKSAGDNYMVVSGVPTPLPDHADAIADLALKMRDALGGLVDPKGRPVPVRIGIASGPVVAGVVGTRKLLYDVWGDAVNMASRMETTGEGGKIQIAPTTRELLTGRFVLEERGVIEVRGKGPMQTSFLIGLVRGESRSAVAQTAS